MIYKIRNIKHNISENSKTNNNSHVLENVHTNTETFKLYFTLYDIHLKIIQYIDQHFLDISYLFDILQIDIYQSSHIKVDIVYFKAIRPEYILAYVRFFSLQKQFGCKAGYGTSHPLLHFTKKFNLFLDLNTCIV